MGNRYYNAHIYTYIYVYTLVYREMYVIFPPTMTLICDSIARETEGRLYILLAPED